MTYFPAISSVDPADGSRLGEFDELFKAPLGISVEHHEIHEGDAYSITHYTAGGTAVALAFKTPAGTKRCHALWEWMSEDKAHFEAGVATWTGSTGSDQEPVNHNDGSVKTSGVLSDTSGSFVANDAIEDPTSLSITGQIAYEASYTSKNAGGDEARGVHEYVLAPETQYGFVLTSDNGSKGLWFRVTWYEHTDG